MQNKDCLVLSLMKQPYPAYGEVGLFLSLLPAFPLAFPCMRFILFGYIHILVLYDDIMYYIICMIYDMY